MITQLWDASEAIELKIPHVKTSTFFRWQEEGQSVFFAINQRGDALECHLAAKGRAKLKLRKAINQMAQYLFMTYPRAEKVVSYSYMNSMKNMCRKCGFKHVATFDDEKADGGKAYILMRFRNG